MKNLLIAISAAVLVCSAQGAFAQRVRRTNASHPIVIGRGNNHVKFNTSEHIVGNQTATHVKLVKTGSAQKKKG